MNDKYEQLKSVIQAANPEIMELKFGCEIDNDSGFIEKIVADVGDGSYLMLDADNQPFRYHGILLKKHIKGRPIRLADVLFALGEKFDSKKLTVDLAGGFQKIGTGWLLCRWNLADDNLDNQSEEMKSCLIELLTK
jgi:hypothetical protein